ncbi:MAG: tetratricopeptide repeat protein [Ignavibacteria bacterium]|nr:tetratricopeptide repeat protein [Ignavibacteria bacterium]
MKLFKIYLVAALLFITGCGVWNDLTTYFNLYFNLSTLFEEAEDKILAERTDMFYFKQAPLAKDISQQLDKVIEKSSKILQFNTKSSYFNDALFITGKSFYYKEEFPKALRKFKELLNRNDEDFNFSARLWVGKTNLQMRNFSEGMDVLDKLKEDTKDTENKEIAQEALYTQIGYWIYRENYETAVEYCYQLIPLLDEKEKISQVYFEMGYLYLEIDSLENAEKSFITALENEPLFDVEFNSQFELGKIDFIRKNYDKALEIFEKLKEEDKYSIFFDKLDLEIANINFEKGEINLAMEGYTKIDSVYKDSPSAGEAAYKLAVIFAEKYKNLDSANVYNEKAFASKADPVIISSARVKRIIYAKYFEYRNELTKLNKQLLYLTDSTAFINDSLIYAAKLDSINKRNEEEGNAPEEQKKTSARPPSGTNRRTAEQMQTQQTGSTDQLIAPVRPQISADSVKSKLSNSYFEMANLFYTELNESDSAKYYYELSLNKYPGYTKNAAKSKFALANYLLAEGNKEKADSLYLEIYNTSNETVIVNESAKQIGKPLINTGADPLEEQMLGAEQLYENKKFEAAAEEYLNIFKSNPSSKMAPKALYAAGFIYENDLNVPENAFNYYDSLIQKYPASEYAKIVRPKVDVFKEELEIKKKREQEIRDSIETANKPVLPDSVMQESIENEEPGEDNLPLEIPAEKDSSDAEIRLPDNRAIQDSSKRKIMMEK